MTESTFNKLGGRAALLLMLSIYITKGSNSCAHLGENGKIENVTEIIQNILSKTNHKLCRPITNVSGALVVRTNIKLVSIGDFREADMQFTIEMYFRQSWRDSRLAFGQTRNSTIPSVTLNGELSDTLWQPDTFFENEVEGKIHGLTMKNKYMRIYNDGRVLTSTRITLICSCPMDFRKFPMDEQECGIYFASYGYTTKDIIYDWESQHETWNGKQEIPQFEIRDVALINKTQEFLTGTFSSLGIKLNLSRRLGHYLTRVYIPAILIVMLSWLSFYVDRHSAPARVSLGITTVLTMTTLLIGVGQGSMPVVSYVKALDWYLFVSYFMVFAAFAEYAVINYRDKAYSLEMIKKQRREATAKKTKQNGIAVKKTKPEETPDTIYSNAVHHEVFDISDCPPSSPQQDKRIGILEWINESLSPPEKTDNLAKKIFPLVFIMFNAGYWLYYLVFSR
ncbi:glycine receptor subunit alpha-3-like [Actinia tenebrosa]|uniref:Glycine receptor subunit alpha-3-like n=1 Tax=Actinia tenebrosa TaxID=6105 RepID=A0A6P8HH79_ACTTE|nr:glycine receptor subunit alpha-3-like [Actinia tenebrosa]XP_031551953.1 glycine receptor subunit alpha-3-like [Actinia tenebrosa]XP_031551954.1 glycine receptor subunit alpha-3-like [Actinia tenebrosa]